MSKSKASWDSQTSKLFIDLCLQQVQQGERKGGSMTRVAWKLIEQRFNTFTGRNYSNIQLKNKYDALRKEWQTWNKLRSSETGLGWYEDKGVMVEEDEGWEKLKLENPAIEKFRFKGMQFSEKLNRLFSNVTATGYCNWAPSSTASKQGREHAYDNDDEGVNLEEGFGDSDNVITNPTGVNGELHRVTLISSQGGSGDASVKGKAPISAGSTQGFKKARGGKKKNAKRSASNVIAEALTDLVRMERAAMERTNKEAQQARAVVPSISTVVTHLQTIQQVRENIDFFVRCMDILRTPENREIYWSLKDDLQLVVEFLHRLCYGGGCS